MTERHSADLVAENERLRNLLALIHDHAALGGEWGEEPDISILRWADEALGCNHAGHFCPCPMDAETGLIGQAPECRWHGYKDDAPTEQRGMAS